MTAVHDETEARGALRSPPLLSLASPAAADRSLAGGKAARLAELTAQGYAVPAGFVITTAALAFLTSAAESELDSTRPARIAAALRSASLASDIRAAFGELGGPVAVRSSGVAEDLADASFAGQYESFLNLADAESVLDAVAKCIASAFTERVRAYGADYGMAVARMAVLVQRFVPARAAGVAFSAHPITGEREVVVISAIPGVGEALVSGQADAEEWEVRAGDVRRKRVTVPVLTERDAQAIATLASSVASGEPTDIEWAFDGDRLLLLQARPMTRVPQPVRWDAPRSGAWIRNFRLGEWIGAPVTPLFESWLLTDVERLMHRRWEKLFGAPVEEPLHVVVNGWYFYGLNMPSSGWMMVRALLTTVRNLFGPNRKEMLAATPPTAHLGFDHEVERWRTTLLPSLRDAVSRAEREVDVLPVAELPALIDRLIAAAAVQMTSIVGVAGYAAKVEMKLATFWSKYLGSHDGAWLELVVGSEVTPAPHDVEGLDWYFPTLGERGPLPPTVSSDARSALLARRDAATARARAALPTRQHVAFDVLVREVRRAHEIRHEQTSQTTLGWPCMRRALHRLAQTLTAQGRLGNERDLFFLQHDELLAILGGTSVNVNVAERCALWERQRQLAPPLLLGTLSGMMKKSFDAAELVLQTNEHLADDALRGMPGSPGRVTGPARVIRGVDELWRLQAGEILVAPVTTPGWTPAFARAIGIVTDTGSIASHASIVAREHGIPAVVGTAEATARICDGQRITVDGSRGVVRLNGSD